MSYRIVAAVAFAGLLAPQVAPARPSASHASQSASADVAQTPQTQRERDELQARILMATKRYKEAVGVYAKLGAEYPKSATYPNFAGIARMQLGDFDGARKNFELATKLDKTFSDAFNNLGTVWFVRKDYKRALRQYQKAISLRPNVAGYYTNVGYAYLKQQRLTQAMQAFQSAIKLDPSVFQENNRNGTVMQQQAISDRGQFDFLLAKGYAQNGDAAQCAVYLRKAFEEGYKDAVKARRDPAFAGVLTDPNVKEVLDRISPPDGKAPPAAPNS